MNEGSGCGCFSFLVVILLVAAVLLNPPEQAHRAALRSRTPVGSLALGAMELAGSAKIGYHNCIVFSYTTIDYGNQTGFVATTGFFGKVY